MFFSPDHLCGGLFVLNLFVCEQDYTKTDYHKTWWKDVWLREEPDKCRCISQSGGSFTIFLNIVR